MTAQREGWREPAEWERKTSRAPFRAPEVLEEAHSDAVA